MPNDFPVTVVNGTPDGISEIVRDVTTQDALRIIMRLDTRFGESAQVSEKKIETVREKVMNDPDLAVEYALLQRESSRRDELILGDLMKRVPEKEPDGPKLVSELGERMELIHSMTDIGSALMYEHVGRRGGTSFATVTWPNLGWWPYCFNDKMSSVIGWGVNWFFEHSWYRGRALAVIGFPYVVLNDLRELNFNDTATSFVAVP